MLRKPSRGFAIGVTVLSLLFAGCAGGQGPRQIDSGPVDGGGVAPADRTIQELVAENEALKRRLRALEPEQPTRIEADDDSERVARFLEAHRLIPLERLAGDGAGVAFRTVAEDDSWTRPAYAEAWHSTYMGGKYSSVANMVHYARNDFFIYTGGNSERSSLIQSLGFAEGSVLGYTRAYPDEPGNGFEILAVSGRIKEIKRLENQWLVTVEPGMGGYHTASVTYGAAGLSGQEPREILFRFATPEGYDLERHVSHLPVR